MNDKADLENAPFLKLFNFVEKMYLGASASSKTSFKPKTDLHYKTFLTGAHKFELWHLPTCLPNEFNTIVETSIGADTSV